MPLGNPHMSRRREMLMRGSRRVKPQWRPATSGITGPHSAARLVSQETLPQAKHTHTVSSTHHTHSPCCNSLNETASNVETLLVMAHVKTPKRLISNAGGWNPAGHQRRWQPNQSAEVTVWKWINSYKIHNTFNLLHGTAQNLCFQQLCFTVYAVVGNVGVTHSDADFFSDKILPCVWHSFHKLNIFFLPRNIVLKKFFSTLNLRPTRL